MTHSIEASDTHGQTFVLRCEHTTDGQTHYFLGSERLHSYIENGMTVVRNRNGRMFFIPLA